MKDIVYWVWLSLVCGPANTDAAYFVNRYNKDIRMIYGLKDFDEDAIKRVSRLTLTQMLNKDLSRAERIVDFCLDHGYKLVAFDADDFPDRLRKISNCPPLLYARGDTGLFNSPFVVGIVGTRNMTDYGKAATFDVARKLCLYNAVTVSGAAYGVDAAVHKTSIYFGCRTIAVLGTGIDVAYPRENSELIEHIARKELLVSEFPPGTRPLGGNFPKRNRIISGIADAVVVTEADMKSGALITAHHAMKQGKPVYAVPGNIDMKRSSGANHIIREGARICTSGEDIVADLRGTVETKLRQDILRDKRYAYYDRVEARRIKYNNVTSMPIPDLDNPPSPEQCEIYLNQTRAKQEEIIERAGLIVDVEKKRLEQSEDQREQLDKLLTEQEEMRRRGEENEQMIRASLEAIERSEREAEAHDDLSKPQSEPEKSSAEYLDALFAKVKSIEGYVQSDDTAAKDSVGADAEPNDIGSQQEANSNESRPSLETVEPNDSDELLDIRRKILKVMEQGELYNSDRLSELSGEATSIVLSAITMLELDGEVEVLPGGMIRIKNI